MNYIYCIINKKIKQNFGRIGVEDKEIHTIPYKNISLVVHDSNEKPKINENDHVICHHYVINFFTKKFNTVIPFGLNTFIKKEKVKPFLEKNHEMLKKRLEHLKDKSEFIVEIFYAPKSKKKTELKGTVKDYILKQKKLRKELIKEIAKFREKFYNQIKEGVDDTKIRDDKEERKPLLSVSCLIHKDKIQGLKESLKKISSMPKFSVFLSGPLPICSFV